MVSFDGHAPQESNLWRFESKHLKLGFPIKSCHAATIPFLKQFHDQKQPFNSQICVCLLNYSFNSYYVLPLLKILRIKTVLTRICFVQIKKDS